MHPRRPLPALDRGLKDSITAISTMGCASSYPRHDQRSECRGREDVRPHRERQRRQEPHRDWSDLEGPHRKRRGPEEPQRERRGCDGCHMRKKGREERDPAQCGSEELHREQRARAEPPIKQSRRQRLHKKWRVTRKPHRERRGVKDLTEKSRREDVYKIGWAHPYVRKGLRFKYHEARGMRDETRRERYEPVRQAKENFRRQYNEYKNGNGVVPAPQIIYRNTVAPSTLNLSGVTLVNYYGSEVPVIW